MAKRPSFQFYTGDWMKDPKLSMCAPASRGIWIDLLCAMHENDQSGGIVGNYEQLARICRCSPGEMETALTDLTVTKTADVTICNDIVTVKCRRMFKEAKDRKNGRERVERFRHKNDSNENVTPPSSSSSSSSSSTSVKKTNSNELGENASPVGESISQPSGKPKKSLKTADERSKHPSIQMVHEIVTRYPHKDLWDKIIREIGDSPDTEFFRASYEIWRSVNGNPMNLEMWLFKPNKSGKQPEIYGAKENGANNGNTNGIYPTKRTNAEIIAARNIDFSGLPEPYVEPSERNRR